MTVADSKVFKFYEDKPGAFDFYRCVGCRRLFTYEQEQIQIDKMKGTGDRNPAIHGCGSKKYSPVRRPYLFEWLKPSVLLYVLKLTMARGVAPWAESKGHQRLVKLAERISSNKLTRVVE